MKFAGATGSGLSVNLPTWVCNRFWTERMNTEALKAAIKEELPGLLREDPALREFIRVVSSVKSNDFNDF